MGRHPRTYPPEFRQTILELLQTGRRIEELAREFDVSAQTIRNWVKHYEVDAGKRRDGLTSEERTEMAKLRRENKRLTVENEILKSRGLVCSGNQLDPRQAFEFVKSYQAVYRISTMCRVLGVSTSGYYAWIGRAPSRRKLSDIALGDVIEVYYRKSRENYGRPRIQMDLRDKAGIFASDKRVARLMRECGCVGATRRKYVVTTKRDSKATPKADLVERK